MLCGKEMLCVRMQSMKLFGKQLTGLVPYSDEVGKGGRLVFRVAKQCGRMPCGGEKSTALFDPVTMLPRDGEIRADQFLGGDPAKADDDARPQQRELTAQPDHTGLALLREGIAVLWGTAFDDIGDIDVRVSRQARRLQKLIEELTAFSDKGKALFILAAAGRFSNEPDRRGGNSGIKHDLRTALAQTAGVTI